MRVLVVAFAALAFAAPAQAQTLLDDAAQSLRSDPVYVHPDTELLSKSDAVELQVQIAREGGPPIFIAILPESARAEADGTSTGVAMRLGRLVGTRGVYAVVVGNQFRAVSTDLGSGEAGRLATEAFQSRREAGVAAVLSDFVRRVGAAGQSPQGDEGSRFWPVGFAVGAAALLGFLFVRRRRRAGELAEVKTAAREDLVALADDVVGLDAEVDRNPEAKQSYARAMEAYQRADDVFDRARSTRELAKVSSALAEARFEMESAKAQLAGQPPPEQRPPCFFDPRHGPSRRDVSWESPYGGWTRVPACERDALRVEAGEEPDVREVEVGGRRRPYWDAPAYYGPWAGGFYGGGLLPGLLIGSTLGATMGAPEDAFAASSGGWDSGDFGGGGDFGGDFGGGGDF
jgi:hypothetical protein